MNSEVVENSVSLWRAGSPLGSERLCLDCGSSSPLGLIRIRRRAGVRIQKCRRPGRGPCRSPVASWAHRSLGTNGGWWMGRQEESRVWAPLDRDGSPHPHPACLCLGPPDAPARASTAGPLLCHYRHRWSPCSSRNWASLKLTAGVMRTGPALLSTGFCQSLAQHHTPSAQ